MNFLVDIPESWLALSPRAISQSWRQSQSGSTLNSGWTIYLNQLCLQTVLPWLQEDTTPQTGTGLNTRALTCIWDVVNGTAIQVPGQALPQTSTPVQPRRLILIPTETIDTDELRVPQEWVDIPDWLGDYYLAVQINLDEGWAKPWGYTTHFQLKTRGQYDSCDRSYGLSQEHLVSDLSLLWLEQQFCPQHQTRATIEPLTELSQTQAEQLIQRLANPEILVPRLEIPFSSWGALLERPQWRGQLYRSRRGLPTIIVKQWFENQLENRLENLVQLGWQSLEAFQSSFSQGSDNPAFGFRSMTHFSEAQVIQVRTVDLEATQVLLVLELTREPDERITIKAQLYPVSGDRYLPPQAQLSLLTDTEEILSSVTARTQDNIIQLQRFKCDPGFNFGIQVTLGDAEVTEHFMA
ncbi:MAG: DUF1822 family protein [Oscillatoriales cyanobacterium RM2_1_1]|nr:DUF1822 family protein [Oscillatoriales cyanobacterium SM2_3_0]NJO45052.1 DUF1822 family protein [Oscillatoriales cyanobacterium RM2_1_1]